MISGHRWSGAIGLLPQHAELIDPAAHRQRNGGLHRAYAGGRGAHSGVPATSLTPALRRKEGTTWLSAKAHTQNPFTFPDDALANVRDFASFGGRNYADHNRDNPQLFNAYELSWQRVSGPPIVHGLEARLLTVDAASGTTTLMVRVPPAGATPRAPMKPRSRSSSPRATSPSTARAQAPAGSSRFRRTAGRASSPLRLAPRSSSGGTPNGPRTTTTTRRCTSRTS